jgi:hypothetical protein
MPDTLWSLGAGAIGWFAVNLAVKPWLEFLALRKEIQEELILLVDILRPARRDTPEFYELSDEAYKADREMFAGVQEKIRRLGSKLGAYNTYLSSSPFMPTSYLLRILGYKIDDASKNLFQLAKAYNDDHITVTRHQVETALRLPHSDAIGAEIVIENRKRRREELALERQADADRSE